MNVGMGSCNGFEGRCWSDDLKLTMPATLAHNPPVEMLLQPGALPSGAGAPNPKEDMEAIGYHWTHGNQEATRHP